MPHPVTPELVRRAQQDLAFQVFLARSFCTVQAFEDPETGYVCRVLKWRGVLYILSITPPNTPIRPSEKF